MRTLERLTEDLRQITIPWIVQQLRITTFHDQGSPAAIDSDGAWLDLFGTPSEEVILKPRERTEIRRIDTSDSRMEMTTIGPKLDLSFSPPPIPSPEFPTLGTLESALPPFVESVRKHLNSPSLTSIERLAFGVVLLLPVESHETGYAKVASLVKELNLGSQKYTDLFFRFNSPTTLPVDGVPTSINRLTSWSVMKTQYSETNFSTREVFREVTKYGVRFELDINTAAESKGEYGESSFDVLLDVFMDAAQKGTHYAV